MKHQMKSFALLILILFFCQSSGFPQQHADSLKKELRSLPSAGDSLETLKSIISTYCSNSIDSCFYYGQLALKIAIRLNDSSSLATVYNYYGNACFYAALYERALEYYQKSQDLFQLLKDEAGLAKTYNNMGIIYEIAGKNDIALEQYNKSLEIWLKINNSSSGESKPMKSIAYLYNNMGIAYNNLGSFDKAIEYYNKSLEISTELQEFGSLSLALNNLGTLNITNKNYEVALKYLNRSLEICRNMNDKHGMANSMNNIGDIFIHLGKDRQAYTYHWEALNLASEINATELIKNACYGLYQYYENQEMSDSALRYQGLFYVLKDSIYSNESKSRIAELENKYAFEKKEKEINLLKAEQELKDVRLKNSRTWLFILIGGIILSMFFIGLIYRQKVQKNHANKELVKKNLEIVKSEEYIRECLEKEMQKIPPPKEQSQEIKYAASSLTNAQKDDLKLLITQALENEKFYLKSNFTIETLSTHLNISRTYISQVINEKLNINFNAFINEYRVKEVIRLLNAEASKNLTIEAIALSVGFGSKSSFNSAFKKYTGTTPSVFLKYSK